MERAGRVELRDLQLGRLLVAPSPVCPHHIFTYNLTVAICQHKMVGYRGIEPRQ